MTPKIINNVITTEMGFSWRKEEATQELFSKENFA